MSGDWRVRVKVINKRDEIVVEEKSFKTEQARAGWLTKNDDDILETLAFSDPKEDR